MLAGTIPPGSRVLRGALPGAPEREELRRGRRCAGPGTHRGGGCRCSLPSAQCKRLEGGLDKLKEATIQLDELNRKLAEQKIVLAEKSAACEALLAEIASNTATGKWALRAAAPTAGRGSAGGGGGNAFWLFNCHVFLSECQAPLSDHGHLPHAGPRAGGSRVGREREGHPPSAVDARQRRLGGCGN